MPVLRLLVRKAGDAYLDEARDDHGRWTVDGGGSALGHDQNADEFWQYHGGGVTDEGSSGIHLVAVSPQDTKIGAANLIAAGMKSSTEDMARAAWGNGQANPFTPPSAEAQAEGYKVWVRSSPLAPGEVDIYQLKDEEAASQVSRLSADISIGYGRVSQLGTPEADEMIRQQAVANLIHNWAESANDTNPKSLAIQAAADQQFGLHHSAEWGGDTSEGPLNATDEAAMAEKVDGLLQQNGGVYRDFLQTQYEATQAMFDQHGITSVDLYRGATDTTGLQEQHGQRVDIQTRPLSSWSTNFETAAEFAEAGPYSLGGPGSMVLMARIPTSQILSTPYTGIGCLNEREMVVIGGELQGVGILQSQEISAYRQEGANASGDFYTPTIVKVSSGRAVNVDCDDANADWIKHVGPDHGYDPPQWGTTVPEGVKAAYAMQVRKYSEDQPRVPAGEPGGGEFGSTGGITPLKPVSTEGGARTAPLHETASMSALPEDKAAAVSAQLMETCGVTQQQAEDNVVAIVNDAMKDPLSLAVAGGEHWYDAAHTATLHVGAIAGLDPAVAVGVMAAVSPGMEWNSNVRAASAIMLGANSSRELTAEEADKLNGTTVKGLDYQYRAGQTFSEVMHDDPRAGAVACNLLVSHCGVQSYDGMTKAAALAVANDPSQIDDTINGMKVRSFFNNIADPVANGGDPTIDSHMVQAMALGVASKDDPETKLRLQLIEKSGSGVMGTPSYGDVHLGVYPALADAMRTATDRINAEHGTSFTPIQVQAIAWVRQIELYPGPTMRGILGPPDAMPSADELRSQLGIKL